MLFKAKLTINIKFVNRKWHECIKFIHILIYLLDAYGFYKIFYIKYINPFIKSKKGIKLFEQINLKFNVTDYFFLLCFREIEQVKKGGSRFSII